MNDQPSSMRSSMSQDIATEHEKNVLIMQYLLLGKNLTEISIKGARERVMLAFGERSFRSQLQGSFCSSDVRIWINDFYQVTTKNRTLTEYDSLSALCDAMEGESVRAVYLDDRLNLRMSGDYLLQINHLMQYPYDYDGAWELDANYQMTSMSSTQNVSIYPVPETSMISGEWPNSLFEKALQYKEEISHFTQKNKRT